MKSRILLLLTVLLLFSQVLYSATFTISTGDSIQTAINNAADGDTIVLNAGTYNQQIEIKGKSLTLTSTDPSNPSQTILDGQNSINYIVRVYQDQNDPNDMAVKLSGITISRASRIAVHCYGLSKQPKLTLDKCIISNNVNTTGFYAGLLLSNTGRVDIISSVIRDNQNNGLGAGLYANSAKIINVVNSVFTGNKALSTTGTGGGMFLLNTEAIFYNTIIYGNTAGNIGGGIMLNNKNAPAKKLKFYNCLINGNKAQNGGGIYLDDVSAIEAYNSVICGNDNHGIYSRVKSASVIKNCILWDNDLAGIYSPPKNIDETEAINVTYSIIKDGYSYGKHIVTDDPEFELAGSWASNVWTEPYVTNPTTAWHLGDLSPGIDGGDPNYCPPSADSLDIDGEQRYIGSRVDIGIDEYISDIAGESGVVYSTKDDYWYWSITDALQYADPDDKLVISPGRYNESVILTDDLDGLTITSIWPHDDTFRNNTIIDADGLATSAVIFSPGISLATNISGLKIINGDGYYYAPRSETVGGGIFCDQASPSISFCRIEDNNAYSGGGVAIVGGSPVFAGCVFKNNTSTNLGPALVALSGSMPGFKNCAFNQNTTDSEDDTNTGALHFDASSSAANSLIRNCLFRENMPYGLYKAGTGFLELNSSIIWSNNKGTGAVDENQVFTPDMTTFELNFCDSEGGWTGTGTDNVNEYPQFKTTTYLDDNGESVSVSHDYMMVQNSSNFDCMNLGDNDYLPNDDELDISGQKRKQYCRVDIGPWEFPSPTSYMQKVPALAIVESTHFCSIQEAIDYAEKNNLRRTIQVTKGTYKENLVISSNDFSINGDSIVSVPSDITIDGRSKIISNTTGPFDTDDPNDPNYMGAAVTLVSGKANGITISGLTLIGSTGSLDTDGKFKGGALFSRNNNDVTIEQCIIRDSTAYDGGGVYISNADSVSVNRTKFYHNTANNTGGSIFLTDCDSVTLTSSMLTQNSAVNGGGIFNDKSKLDISFCTIADNEATVSGGAINTTQAIADTTISNCIITGNTPDHINDSSSPSDKKIVVDYTCITGGFTGENNFDLDPKFLDAANLDYRISVYSPCFNAGKPDSEIPYELAELGKRSIMSTNHSNFNYDIGAYEMVNVVADYHKSRPVHNINSGQDYYTIQDAVQDASPYDTIELQPGLYNELITISTEGLTIRSAMTPSHLAMHRTIIQAGVVDTEDGDINNASTSAITLAEMQAANITIEGVTIMDGIGEKRLYNYYSNSTDNEMKTGGGILSINNDGLTLRWVNLINNTADCGGGLALLGCSNVTLEHCLISNNTANRRRGGAIWAADGCTGLTINNCTISGNVANDTKSTVDSITTQCGGILLENGFSNISLKNSVLWNNTLNNMVPLNHSDISATYCLLPGNSGANNIATDPLFVNPGKFDYHLQSTVGSWHTWRKKWQKNQDNSPAIDIGDGTTQQKAAELYPAGANINLGVYGGSPQASLSYVQAQTPAEKANLNGDSQVDISDLAILAATWYSSDCFNQGDINRDCSVDMADLEAFLNGWLQ